MPASHIHIETGYNDKGVYCLFAITSKFDYEMPINLDNLDDVVAMLNNAIIDIQSEERMMLAKENEIDNE